MDRNYLEWLISAGKRTEARDYLSEHLKTHQGDGRAWYDLADLVDDPTQRAECLRIAYEQGYRPAPQPPASTPPPASTASQPAKRRSGIPLLLVLIALMCLVMYAIGSRRSAAPSSPARTVLLSCQECADAGMLISLWAEPGVTGAKLTGKLSHNTTVTILDTRTVDGDLWYRVSAAGQSGWVRYTFTK